MKINILICTIDEGIERVHRIIQPALKDISYIISHQYQDKRFKVIPAELKRKDIILSQIPGRGLSRNRNNAIKLADGDIALISDDDVEYLPGSFEIIRGIFENDKELAVACFKIKTPDGEPEYKKYPKKSYALGILRHHYISSVEIAFRIDLVKKAIIFFDERFGLGSNFTAGGEEDIFIHDCLTKGLRIVYYPLFIVKHSDKSSTKRLPSYDLSRGMTMSATDAYKTPLLAIPKAIGRTFKYTIPMIANRKNPCRFLYRSLLSIIHVWGSKGKRHRVKNS